MIFLVCCVQAYVRKNQRNFQNIEEINSVEESKNNLHEKNQIICSIYLLNEVNVMTSCGHYYHLICLDLWLHQN